MVGTSVQTLVMSSHFFLKRCTLRIVRPLGAGNAGCNRSFFRMGLLTVGRHGNRVLRARRVFPRRPAAARRDCRRMGRAAACRIRDGGSCRGSAAQDTVRGKKRRSVRLPRPPLNSAKNRFLSMPVSSATAASSSLFFFMYFLGILPESVAYLTLRHILPIETATARAMLFMKIIRHLPIILQVHRSLQWKKHWKKKISWGA